MLLRLVQPTVRLLVGVYSFSVHCADRMFQSRTQCSQVGNLDWGVSTDLLVNASQTLHCVWGEQLCHRPMGQRARSNRQGSLKAYHVSDRPNTKQAQRKKKKTLICQPLSTASVYFHKCFYLYNTNNKA